MRGAGRVSALQRGKRGQGGGDETYNTAHGSWEDCAWTGLVQSFGRNGRRGKGRGQSTTRLRRGCAPSFASRLWFVCAPVNWNSGRRAAVCRQQKALLKGRSADRGTPSGRSLCERNGHRASFGMPRWTGAGAAGWAAGAASCDVRVCAAVALRPVGTRRGRQSRGGCGVGGGRKRIEPRLIGEV